MKKQLCWIVMATAALSLERGSASAQLTMQEAASQGLLRPLDGIEIFTFATFWSWQSSSPLPYNPCPDCTTYALSDGSGVLVDDRDVPYWVFGNWAGSQFSGDGPLDNPPPDYGCGLWLELHIVASVAQVTLHNVVPGRTYNLWSSPDLAVPVASWAFETTRIASSSDPIVIPIALQGRPPTLFFRASEVRDYAIQTRFDGVSAADVPGMACPDSMGAVGTDRFVELINGMIRVYTKGGIVVTQDTMNSFFHIHQNNTDYPTGGAIDPRIFYDASVTPHRWVACCVDENGDLGVGSFYALLAVSTSSSPDNLPNGWVRYLVQVQGALQSVGMDANGIYLDRVTYQGMNQPSHTIVAVKKSDLYNGTLTYNSVTISSDPAVPVHYMQPACNFDSLGPTGYTFLLGKGAPGAGPPYRGGSIYYHRLRWDGSTAHLVVEPWIQLDAGPHDYRDYYDLTGSPVSAPQSGDSIDISTIGSDLMPRAMIRNGVLWFCHAVGLSGPSGTYTGDANGTLVDRSAVQWFKARADTLNGSLTYLGHGRIYDTAATNPHWYYFPSIAVNCAGDMVAGFSASSATSYIGAYYSWLLAGGLPSDRRLIQNGFGPYYDSRWGDYSIVVVDPSNPWSFWTVQEYADYPDPEHRINTWRTVIAEVSVQQ